MVILTKRCWFRGYFREAQSLVVILAKSFGFVAKIAKIKVWGGGWGYRRKIQHIFTTSGFLWTLLIYVGL